MTIFAELNGIRVQTGTVTIPYHGIWHADVVLDQASELVGPLTLTVGNLVSKCVAFRSGTVAGSTHVRLLGGAGGWMKLVTAKEYLSIFGVKFSLIAGDAAKEVGERVLITNDFSVGKVFERQASFATRVLDMYAPLWWMRADGVTSTDARATPTIATAFDVIKDGTNLGLGKVTIATDFPADWQPGVRASIKTKSRRSRAKFVQRW